MAVAERGADQLSHVLRAIGEIEEDLRGRRDHAVPVIEQETTDGAAHGRAARLLGEDGIRPQALGQEARLRALPAPLDPLESDERHAAF